MAAPSNPLARARPIGLALLGLACAEPQADTASADAGTDTDTGTDMDPPGLAREPEVIHHPNQPMIVDVIVELDRPADVHLRHDDDPGVRVASLAVEDEGRRHHLRVRGLAPLADHAMSLERVDPETRASATDALQFTTGSQLTGYRETFDYAIHDASALDPAYRLFDYGYTAFWDPTGIFAIDAQGRTRWYYADTPQIVAFGAVAVWAGIDLRDDGTLLCVRDGGLTILDELGEVRLRFDAADYGLSYFHHDAQELQSGNFMTLGNDFREIDLDGFGPTLVAGDLLVEFDPAGEIVWTWSAFDHLDPQRTPVVPGTEPEYYDSVTGELAYDWTHGNGMLDMPEDGQILLSMRHQDWIIAIDHQSGDVAWRLGDGGDFALQDGTWFYHQHSPQWQDDGSLLLYDNGIGNPAIAPEDSESRAVRYALDFDAMTATQVWDDRAMADFVISPGGGDADRTPAGNVLVTDTSTTLVENFATNVSRVREVDYATGAPISTLTSANGTYIYRATATTRLPGEPLE